MSGPGEGRTAVVLAAGFGSRLQAEGARSLKPLTPVAGVPLLQRTFQSLEVAGCSRIVVVVGYGGDEVRAAAASMEGQVAAEIAFVDNPAYELSNGVSVLAARPEVPGAFLLTMADHVFGDECMRRAAGHHPPLNGATLLVDYDIEGVFDLDDATKVREEDGHIVSIGKQITDYNCIDTGLFVCTPGLMDALQAVYDARGDASLSDGVQALARHGRMDVLDIGESFWQDVDTPEMLAEAERRLAR